MATTELTVETVPASVPVEERDGSRRVDFSFLIRNAGPDELELLAVEQDVYNASGALIQLRVVDENGEPIPVEAERGSRISAGEQRTIPNPLPDFAPGMPLDALVYRFVFRTITGRVLQSTIRLSPIAGSTRLQLAPAPRSEHEQQPVEQRAPAPAAPNAESERPTAPTPRQLARSWFETLYGLGVYAPA